MRPILLSALVLVACDGTTDEEVPTDTEWTVDASSFDCITDMTSVRSFYIDNLAGDLDASLAVAEDPGSADYPEGTLIQLVPTEAMVKREAGFSASSNDWEFFFLSLEGGSATIVDRGVEGVMNQFGGECLSCHAAAAETWDYVCEEGHGCVTLSLDENTIRAIQQADPRCN